MLQEGSGTKQLQFVGARAALGLHRLHRACGKLLREQRQAAHEDGAQLTVDEFQHLLAGS